MTIHIEGLSFNTIIGLMDVEREHAQSVSIDLKLDYHYSKDHFIDYADLCILIEEKVQRARYTLLEEALVDLETLILSSYPQIQRLYLKITKPDIIANATVALSQQWHY